MDEIKEIMEILNVANCGYCEYDEAEGTLLKHCDRCCRRIATEIWSLFQNE